MSILFDEIYEIPQYTVKERLAVLSGRNVFDADIPSIPLNSMNTMVCGAPGMGKTTQIQKLMKQTMEDPNSTHIVFDPKGEAYKLFYREGKDHIISLFDLADVRHDSKWNLMKDAAESLHPETTLREIAKSICKEAVEKSHAPFFPESAESLMSAIWIMIYRRYKNNLPCNDVLIQKTRSLTREQLMTEARKPENSDLYSIIDELTDPEGKVTTINIKQEMEHILSQAFNPEGNFCSKKGAFSVLDFIRHARGERLFLVYDFATADNSRQIFSTMLNMMFKETIAINAKRNKDTRIYWYLDELPVLPYIENFNSLCCFGRSTRNIVIIGIQGLSQIYDVYGEEKGNAILSAFTESIIMRTNDPVTVERLSRRSGQKTVIRTRMGSTRKSVESKPESTYSIPEDVMSDLDVGEVIMSIRGVRPFFVRLNQ